MPRVKKRLYIAYGANLNVEQMALRCPTAKVIGTAILENWRLVFRGVASVERQVGSYVPVLIWHLQPEDELALNSFEGWPHLYRKEMRRIRLNGKMINAMIYVMNNVRDYNPPSSHYYETIRAGYKWAGFDEDILQNAALESIWNGGCNS